MAVNSLQMKDGCDGSQDFLCFSKLDGGKRVS